MCGRFTQTRPAREVAELLGLEQAPDMPPRYNVAPTQRVFVARASGGRRAGAWMRWGLVPSWAADLSVGARMLNARADTVAQKPAYRQALARRRCLIAADGFYEWRSEGKKKRPVHFRYADGRPFALAGLWERWLGPDGEVLSCAVLTTDANALVRPVHDRMPVILPPERFGEWLDEANHDTASLLPLLAPHDPAEMAAVAVNERVNNARNEGPECWALA